MARPSRLDVIFQRHSDPVWFLTLTTASREPWLSEAVVHAALQNFAERGLEAGRATIGRYVLMPDHLHFFVRLGPEEFLAHGSKHSRRCYHDPLAARLFNGRTAFFDHLLPRSERYAQKREYVRQNPVRAGLVRQAEDWPFQGEVYPLYFE